MQVSFVHTILHAIYDFIANDGFILEFEDEHIPERRPDCEGFEKEREKACKAFPERLVQFEYLTDWLSYWLARGGAHVCNDDFVLYMQAVALAFADATQGTVSWIEGKFSALMPPASAELDGDWLLGRMRQDYLIPNALSKEFFDSCTMLHTSHEYLDAHTCSMPGTGWTKAGGRYNGGARHGIDGTLPFITTPTSMRFED